MPGLGTGARENRAFITCFNKGTSRGPFARYLSVLVGLELGYSRPTWPMLKIQENGQGQRKGWIKVVVGEEGP